MFGFLKLGNGGDDPLGSLKNITQWLKHLPKGDIHSAQKAVVEKLVAFNQAQQVYNKERLAVLLCLDEQSREMQGSLCSQYLRNPLMSRVTEGRLWAVIQGYYYEVARGYHAFLMHFVANPGERTFQSLVPIMTARALRAMADILKWRYFHFEQIDAKLWLRMHNLYRMAEYGGFADRKLLVYDNETRRSSCREEYMQALLLSLFSTGSLLPKQIEIIDHWLDNWAELVPCDAEFDPDRHCFYVDTAKGQGLQRIRNPDDNPAKRYVSAATIRAKAAEIQDLLKSGTAPAALGLGEDFRLPEGYMLLDLVEDEWAPLDERERRNDPREPRQGHWEVVHDLANIFTVLQAALGRTPENERTTMTAEEILDIKLYGFITERTRAAQTSTKAPPTPTDKRTRWVQIDESDEGIGFAASGAGINWAKTGRLLAMRPEGSQEPWQIGSVRRVAANNGGQRVIGVNFLGGEIEFIDLEQEDITPDPVLAKYGYEVHDMTHGPGQLGHALLVTATDGNQSIVLESPRYGYGRQYLIRLANTKTQLVELATIQTKGEDWLMAAYKVLA